MKIIFGLELEDLVIPQSPDVEGGTHYFGPKGLLFMLESHLGLIGHPVNNEYLRIEQYRQAILRHLKTNETPFYKASFDADNFAAATELLSRKDELLLAGWNFELKNNLPDRLKVLSELEQIFKDSKSTEEPLSLSPGYADRFVDVLNKLDKREHPITSIELNEPADLLPYHFQKLFIKLQKTAQGDGKDFLQQIQEEGRKLNSAPNTDLQQFQNRLLYTSGKKEKIHRQIIMCIRASINTFSKSLTIIRK